MRARFFIFGTAFVVAIVMLLVMVFGLLFLTEGSVMAFSPTWYGAVFSAMFFPGYWTAKSLYLLSPEPAPMAMMVMMAISSWIIWSAIVVGGARVWRLLVRKTS